MAIDGVQLKVKFPHHLHKMLQNEARAAGVTKADLVRLAVAKRYEPVSVNTGTVEINGEEIELIKKVLADQGISQEM